MHDGHQTVAVRVGSGDLTLDEAVEALRKAGVTVSRRATVHDGLLRAARRGPEDE
jgi:hypothetical protein